MCVCVCVSIPLEERKEKEASLFSAFLRHNNRMLRFSGKKRGLQAFFLVFNQILHENLLLFGQVVQKCLLIDRLRLDALCV